MTEPNDYMITINGEEIDREWLKDAPTRTFVEDRLHPLATPEQLDRLKTMQRELHAVAHEYVGDFDAIDISVTVRLPPTSQMIEVTILKDHSGPPPKPRPQRGTDPGKES